MQREVLLISHAWPKGTAEMSHLRPHGSLKSTPRKGLLITKIATIVSDYPNNFPCFNFIDLLYSFTYLDINIYIQKHSTVLFFFFYDRWCFACMFVC